MGDLTYKFPFLRDIAHPTAWSGHMEFGHQLVQEIKPKLIVELGTHYGHSFFSFCQGVKDAGLDTKLCAVDTWKGDKFTNAYDSDVKESVDRVIAKHFPDLNIKLYQKTFDAARSTFKNKSIDLLHLDGSHDYESVRNDVDNWFPKVKDGGVILMHDVAVNDPRFGVMKVWQEIKNEHPEWQYQLRFESFGLGVIRLPKIDGKDSDTV